MPRVFISYVRQNNEDVQRLVNALKVSGIEVWLDREQIRPGYRWADAIREAISQGDFFIACFSKEYGERSKTYMNEELTLAIEQLRQRPADRSWFIPVLLSDCQVPDRSIGAGETLRSIQWVTLYEDWDCGVKSIVSVIQPISAELPRLDVGISITNFAELWTPRTIRLGLSSGLLTEEVGQIEFSEQFLDTLCTEGKKWSRAEYPKWDDFIVVSMARSTYRNGVEVVPLHQEEMEYLFSKLSLRVFDYLINIGLKSKVLEATQESISVDEGMQQEVIDSSETQGDEHSREFFIQLFIKMTQARLILYQSEQTRFSHVLGMLAFSLWWGKGYIDSLEGLSRSDRTDISGVTHPPRL